MPKDILSMTHREFSMLCEENIERTHDENEREAMYAIMYAAASRGKGKKGKLPKVEELYNRDNTAKKESPEDIVRKQQEAKEWLKTLDLSKL